MSADRMISEIEQGRFAELLRRRDRTQTLGRPFAWGWAVWRPTTSGCATNAGNRSCGAVPGQVSRVSRGIAVSTPDVLDSVRS